MKIRLETSHGALVLVTQIPAFKESPEFIVWGNRVFLFHDSVFQDGQTFSVYSEIEFGYALPDKPERPA